MRLVDIFFAFPFYVMVIALVFVLGAGERSIYLAIATVGWVSYARIIRGEVLVAKRQDYVTGRAVGGLSNLRIMRRHLLPNVLSQAIIYAMCDIVQDIMAIVTLGYLGLGIPPPTAEWGSMITDGQNFITTHWQLATIPGLAVVRRRPGAVAGRRRPGRPAEAGPVSAQRCEPRRTPLLEVRDLRVRIASRRGIVRAVDGVSLRRRPGAAPSASSASRARARA